MPNDFMNLHYVIEKKPVQPLTQFQSIWKVEANDSYRVKSEEGFDEPVLFFTWEGNGVLETYGIKDSKIYDLKSHSFLILDRQTKCHYYCQERSNWNFFFLRFTNMNIVNELRLEPGILYSTEQTLSAFHLCEKMRIISHRLLSQIEAEFLHAVTRNDKSIDKNNCRITPFL